MKAMMYTAPVLDTVYDIKGTYPLQQDKSYGILAENKSIGGPCTTIVGTKRMGIDMFPVGAIGDDAAGKEVCRQFAEEGIPTDALEVSDAYKTRQVIGIVGEDHKHCYVYDSQLFICNLDFCKKYIDDVDLAGFSGFSMTAEAGNEGNAAKTVEVMRYCKEKGIPTILDPGSMMDNIPQDLLKEACTLMDYIMLNMEEAQYLSGIADGDAVTCGIRICEIYGGVAIVKDGGRGAAWCTAQGGTMYPAYKVEVVNTNGAGDTFQAGFIYGLLSGKSEAEIMSYAAATAALKVAAGGSADRTPYLKDVEEFLAKQK